MPMSHLIVAPLEINCWTRTRPICHTPGIESARGNAIGAGCVSACAGSGADGGEKPLRMDAGERRRGGAAMNASGKARENSNAELSRLDSIQRELHDLFAAHPLGRGNYRANGGLDKLKNTGSTAGLNEQGLWWLEHVTNNGGRPSENLREFLKEEVRRNKFHAKVAKDLAILDGAELPDGERADPRQKTTEWELEGAHQREKGDHQLADIADNMTKRWRELALKQSVRMGGDPRTVVTALNLIELAKRREMIAADKRLIKYLPSKVKDALLERADLLALALSLYLNGEAPRENGKFFTDDGVFEIRFDKHGRRSRVYHEHSPGEWILFGDIFAVMGKIIRCDSKSDFLACAMAVADLIRHFRIIRSDSLADLPEWEALSADAAADVARSLETPASQTAALVFNRTVIGNVGLLRALDASIVKQIGVVVVWLLLLALSRNGRGENRMAKMSPEELVAQSPYPRMARDIFPQLWTAGLIPQLQRVQNWDEWTDCVEALLEWGKENKRFVRLRAALVYWYNSLQKRKKRFLPCNQYEHSVKCIAELAGCDPDTARDVGKKMEKKGILTRNRGKGKNRRWAGYQLRRKIPATLEAVQFYLDGTRKTLANRTAAGASQRQRGHRKWHRSRSR